MLVGAKLPLEVKPEDQAQSYLELNLTHIDLTPGCIDPHPSPQTLFHCENDSV